MNAEKSPWYPELVQLGDKIKAYDADKQPVKLLRSLLEGFIQTYKLDLHYWAMEGYGTDLFDYEDNGIDYERVQREHDIDMFRIDFAYNFKGGEEPFMRCTQGYAAAEILLREGIVAVDKWLNCLQYDKRKEKYKKLSWARDCRPDMKRFPDTYRCQGCGRRHHLEWTSNNNI